MIKKIKEYNNLRKYLKYINNLYGEYFLKDIMPEFKTLKENIDNGVYKGIIVYSTAVMWEPIQRPHHFLKSFADDGYLCFFCETNLKENYVIKEKFKNVYLVNGEEKLIPLIKDQKVIFLITYFLQYVFARYFDNKVVWFDLLDRLDFMSYHNLYSKKVYSEIIENADIITYTSNNLKHYLNGNKNAILVPNGANVEDFRIENDCIVPDDMENILKDNKPILGYFGAIEKWFDFKLINVLDKCDKYNIVLIGKIGDNLNYEKYNFKNVYFLGPKPFNELKNYAKYFDVAMIPFIVNKLTNTVSPVKFYEYMALGLPVITTPIYEMKQYNLSILKFVNIDNVIKETDILLNMNKKDIKEITKKVADDNTWKQRIEVVKEKLR